MSIALEKRQEPVHALRKRRNAGELTELMENTRSRLFELDALADGARTQLQAINEAEPEDEELKTQAKERLETLLSMLCDTSANALGNYRELTELLEVATWDTDPATSTQ